MCILLNVKKHEKTFALNVDIFKLQAQGMISVIDKVMALLYYDSVS